MWCMITTETTEPQWLNKNSPGNDVLEYYKYNYIDSK